MAKSPQGLLGPYVMWWLLGSLFWGLWDMELEDSLLWPLPLVSASPLPSALLTCPPESSCRGTLGGTTGGLPTGHGAHRAAAGSSW